MARGDNTRKLTDAQVIEALRRHGGNIRATARDLGVARITIRRRRERLAKKGHDLPEPVWLPAHGEAMPDTFRETLVATYAQPAARYSGGTEQPLSAGRIETRDVEIRKPPRRGQVATYLLTSATNNTELHGALWANLHALMEHYSAHGPVELLVRRIGYNLAEWRRRGASNEVEQEIDGDPIRFDPQLLPYICDERVELAPGLHWAGDAPVSATAVSPLSGYDTFTGEASGIFGATKLEMRSVATMRGLPAKHLFTTGAVTQRNYSETKAGQRADWHHVFGATLVEVENDGTWFIRPIVAEDDGTIRDINVTIRDSEVIEGPNMAALTPGDVHVAELDRSVMKAIYGPGGMVDGLRPAELHHHDLHDHKARSHHDERDPFRRFLLHNEGTDEVEQEIEADAGFLQYCARDWMRQVVVGSNHDDHLQQWLKRSDWRSDPINAVFYLRCALRVCEAIEVADRDFHLLEWACRQKGAPEDVVFLRQDQSWLVEGVECGLHGDKGPNGSRGSARNLARIGSKVTIGHSHSPAIIDGCWQTGVTAGTLDGPTLDYAVGPSSWSRTLVATYEGGKRTTITMRGTRWRARRRKLKVVK